VFSTLMFSRDDWEIAERTMRRGHRARTVLLAAGSAASMGIGRLLARLDRFELLTFQEADGVDGPLEAVDACGRRVRGADALADVIAALPLGPLVAFVPRLP